MTGRAFNIWIVFVRIDAPDVRPAATGIGQRIMTPQTECPAFVNGEFRRVGRVFNGWTVTVFALDYLMRGLIDAVVLVAVTILTILFTHVLHLEIFPLLFIPFAMPAVHVSPLTDAETFGN